MTDTIVTECTSCRTKLRIPDPGSALKKVRCPKCGAAFVASAIAVASQPAPEAPERSTETAKHKSSKEGARQKRPVSDSGESKSPHDAQEQMAPTEPTSRSNTTARRQRLAPRRPVREINAGNRSPVFVTLGIVGVLLIGGGLWHFWPANESASESEPTTIAGQPSEESGSQHSTNDSAAVAEAAGPTQPAVPAELPPPVKVSADEKTQVAKTQGSTEPEVVRSVEPMAVPDIAGAKDQSLETVNVDDRSSWIHGGGEFQITTGNLWVENRRRAAPLQFEEKTRSDEFVELFDRSRGIWIRLFSDRAEGRQEGRSQWAPLYPGGWSKSNSNESPVPQDLVSVYPEMHDPEKLQLVVQAGHKLQVNFAAFSPDRRQVITAGGDSTVRIWDAESGKELRKIVGNWLGVASADLSSDGKQIVIGTEDATARILDLATGKELRQFLGVRARVSSVKFSPDGRYVLTGCSDNSVQLWDIEAGNEVRRFEGHSDSVSSVAFSPDGRQILTGSFDRSARLWDVGTGKELRKFEGHSQRVGAVGFSPDSDRIVTGSQDRTSRIWDRNTGQEIHQLKGHLGEVCSTSYSPDGRSIVTGGADSSARVWDAEKGQEKWCLRGRPSRVLVADFSSDGERIITGTANGMVSIWDAKSGGRIRPLSSQTSLTFAARISGDGSRIVTAGDDNVARVWDLASDNEPGLFKGHSGPILDARFSTDGTRLITGSEDNSCRIWDVNTGRELLRLTGHTAKINAVGFAPNNQKIVTAGADNTCRIWDATTGRQLNELVGHTNGVTDAAFSPDGTRIVTGGGDLTVRVWDAESGQELRKLIGEEQREWPHMRRVMTAKFSPDGQRIITTGPSPPVRIWSAESGEELCKINAVPHAVGFSPDGQRIVGGGVDKRVRIWDAENGQELLQLTGHSYTVGSAEFSPDSQWVITSSVDQTVRIWNAATGQELCRLVSFSKGGWAVTDPAGRYDASNGGHVNGLHWVIRDEPIALDQLKERYYEPGLLAKLMGFNKEPLRDVQAFSDPKLYPEVQLAAPAKESSRLTIDLKKRSGGFGKVVVKVNGKELTGDARGLADNAQIVPRGDDLKLSVDLKNDPRLKPGELNQIEVFAYNEEGYLSSRGFSVEYTPPGEQEITKPDVWAIVAGVSDYRGDAIDLRYAAKDADDLATALKVSASRLFGADKLHLTTLSTSHEDPASKPTRQNLSQALDAARAAKPGDILLIYLAGHGVNFGGQDGDFYYLTSEASSGELNDSAVREQVALSSQQLTEAIKQIPALKQVLILDTCASGAMVQKLTEKRDISSSQIRALERVKDRTGMFVLAGCAADAVSYEASNYGQGLLTHSLLLGMRGGALREDQYVDVSSLFNFASDQVPQLAQGVGGIQRPVVASPQGGASFDIGQVTETDKASIPLQSPRPLVLRANFQDEDAFEDTLGLAKLVNLQLREISTRGQQSPLVYLDASELPSAYRLAGRYVVEGDQVTLTVVLSRGDDRKRFTIEGKKSELETMVKQIVEETQRQLANP